MTSAEITQLRIRAVDSLKARGVAHPMPDMILTEMKRLDAMPVDSSAADILGVGKMFEDLFGMKL